LSKKKTHIEPLTKKVDNALQALPERHIAFYTNNDGTQVINNYITYNIYPTVNPKPKNYLSIVEKMVAILSSVLKIFI